jgi:5-methylcytosine-specific restriction endonuclease McrA
LIKPEIVFARDKWRCQLCKVRTPKRLRGTTHPRAPELDHIVPIAAGGDHTWNNVQCACRKCNGEKGSAPAGQLLLIDARPQMRMAA